MTRQSVYTCTIETVEQPILGSIPVHPLNRLPGGCRHYCFSLDTILNPTGMGTSVGKQSKLRRQICGDSFPFDSASSGRQHKAGTGWTLGHLICQLNHIFRRSINRSKHQTCELESANHGFQKCPP